MNKEKELKWKVTINTFSKGDKEITCIGMIHIASEDFYKVVQKIINLHEFGFYEGLNGKSTELSTGKKIWLKVLNSLKPKNGLYVSLSSLLNMVPQSQHIRYPEKWVNADLSWQELIKISPSPVLSKLAMFLKVANSAGKLVKKEDGNVVIGGKFTDIVSGLGSIVFWGVTGKLFGKINNHNELFEKYILHARDQVACRYIKDWNEEKLSLPNKCAIVYGQAHMEGIQNYLVQEGFRCKETREYNAD